MDAYQKRNGIMRSIERKDYIAVDDEMNGVITIKACAYGMTFAFAKVNVETVETQFYVVLGRGYREVSRQTFLKRLN